MSPNVSSRLLIVVIIACLVIQSSFALAFTPSLNSAADRPKIVFVTASWVGPITNVRYNILTPQFWWDMGNELTYEKLAVFVRRDNSFIPWLAKSWEWKDQNTLVIHLRENVTWSDGQPFTAWDVWTEITIIKAWGWREYQDIQSVEVPNKYTIIIHFKPGCFRLLEMYFVLYSFPMALPYHIFGKYAQQVEEGLKEGNRTKVDVALEQVYNYQFKRPIGTGPYILANKTSAEAIFVKNPHYWNPAYQVLDEVKVIRAQDNPHMWAYYEGGTVDSGDAVMPPQVESAVLSKPWAKIIKVPDSGVALYFNTNSTYLRDVRVRQAIAYIIDRTKVLSAWSNIYTPVKIPDALSDWMRPHWLDQATIKMLKPYNRNLDMARQLLEEAGFKYNEANHKWYTPDGKVFELRFYAPSGWTDWNTIGQAIAKELTDFGITVDYRAVEDSTLWGQIWPSKTWDLILNWWGPWNLVHPWVCHWQWISRFRSIGLPLVYRVPGIGLVNATKVWNELTSNNPTVVRNATRILSLLVDYDLPILPIGEKNIPVFVNTRKGLHCGYEFEWPGSSDPLWYDASISRFETTLVLLYLHHAKVIITSGQTSTSTTTTTHTTAEHATTTTTAPQQTSTTTTPARTTSTVAPASPSPTTSQKAQTPVALIGAVIGIIIVAVIVGALVFLRKK